MPIVTWLRLGCLAVLLMAGMIACDKHEFAGDNRQGPAKAKTKPKGTVKCSDADSKQCKEDHTDGHDDKDKDQGDKDPGDDDGTGDAANEADAERTPSIGADTASGTANVKPDPELELDQALLKLPGAPVDAVSVRFEDENLAEGDYDDTVFCFRGKFKFNQAPLTMTSLAAQAVQLTTSRSSACVHKIDATISHPDGTTEAFSQDDRGGSAAFNLNFKKGSTLQFKMTTIESHKSGQCAITFNIPKDPSNGADQAFFRISGGGC